MPDGPLGDARNDSPRASTTRWGWRSLRTASGPWWPLKKVEGTEFGRSMSSPGELTSSPMATPTGSRSRPMASRRWCSSSPTPVIDVPL